MLSRLFVVGVFFSLRFCHISRLFHTHTENLFFSFERKAPNPPCLFGGPTWIDPIRSKGRRGGGIFLSRGHLIPPRFIFLLPLSQPAAVSTNSHSQRGTLVISLLSNDNKSRNFFWKEEEGPTWLQSNELFHQSRDCNVRAPAPAIIFQTVPASSLKNREGSSSVNNSGDISSLCFPNCDRLSKAKAFFLSYLMVPFPDAMTFLWVRPRRKWRSVRDASSNYGHSRSIHNEAYLHNSRTVESRHISEGLFGHANERIRLILHLSGINLQFFVVLHILYLLSYYKNSASCKLFPLA